MKLTYFRTLAIIGIVSHFGAVTAQSIYQRMGIAAGTNVKIAKNSQQSIPSYCLDFGVPYALEKSFHHVISPGSAVVKFADMPPMNLEKAIARQPGNKPSLLKIIASDTDAKLILINNRNVECTVEFKKNTGLATKRNEMLLDVTDMQSLLTQNSRQDTRQNNTWMANSARYRENLQYLLAELGYYQGEMDATLNNTQQAIIAFQKANQLSETNGSFNDQTYDALLAKCKLVYNKLSQIGLFLMEDLAAIHEPTFRLTRTFREIRSKDGFRENFYYGVEHQLNKYAERRLVKRPLHLREFESLIELEMKLNQHLDIANVSDYTTIGITITSTANRAVRIRGVAVDNVAIFGSKLAVVALLLPILTEPALVNITKASSIPDKYKKLAFSPIFMQLENPHDFQRVYSGGNKLPPGEPPFKIGDELPIDGNGLPIRSKEACELTGSICVDQSGTMEMSIGCEGGLGFSVSTDGATKISAASKHGDVSINLGK